jgi:hypothetical protein
MPEVVSAEQHLTVAPMTEEPEHRLKHTWNRKNLTYLHKKLASTQLKHRAFNPRP